MFPLAHVAIHPSAFPERSGNDLLDSLRKRQINPKLHYASLKQAQKWLALHRACSPARTDPAGAAIYDSAFTSAAARMQTNGVHVVGLGCGGGTKDTRLLKCLRDAGAAVCYTPCDVSVPLVLEARQTALSVVAEPNCFPLVCDLGAADDLGELLQRQEPVGSVRLLTFFGMIPNFEPQIILPRLAGLVRPGDWLLLSANLAPGNDYAAGMRRILPQYDNDLTRDWLMTLLLDLGIEAVDGDLRFGIEDASGAGRLKRVVADFAFKQPRRITVEGEQFEFRPGNSIRVFFSFRYTPALATEVLKAHQLRVVDQWITPSGEEGVFLCDVEPTIS